MKAPQRHSGSIIVKHFSFLLVVLALLILPCKVFADSQLLLRIVDSIDIVKLSEELKDLKLSPVFRLDEKGNLIVNCLNCSLPLAYHPFEDSPGVRKMLQNARLQIDPKKNGVMVKLAFLF